MILHEIFRVVFPTTFHVTVYRGQRRLREYCVRLATRTWCRRSHWLRGRTRVVDEIVISKLVQLRKDIHNFWEQKQR